MEAGQRVQLHMSGAGARPPDDGAHLSRARVRGRGLDPRAVRGQDHQLQQAHHPLPVRQPDLRELRDQQTVRDRDAAHLHRSGPGPRVSGRVSGPRLFLQVLKLRESQLKIHFMYAGSTWLAVKKDGFPTGRIAVVE